jgi:hypothetical protein
MDLCLLWVLCVVRYRYLRRADHPSRGVLTDCGASLCVIWEPRKWRGPDPLGGCCTKRKTVLLYARRNVFSVKLSFVMVPHNIWYSFCLMFLATINNASVVASHSNFKGYNCMKIKVSGMLSGTRTRCWQLIYCPRDFSIIRTSEGKHQITLSLKNFMFFTK